MSADVLLLTAAIQSRNSPTSSVPRYFQLMLANGAKDHGSDVQMLPLYL
jgi:hypothetical protein